MPLEYETYKGKVVRASEVAELIIRAHRYLRYLEGGGGPDSNSLDELRNRIEAIEKWLESAVANPDSNDLETYLAQKLRELVNQYLSEDPSQIKEIIEQYLTEDPSKVREIIKQYLTDDPSQIEEIIDQHLTDDPSVIESIIQNYLESKGDTWFVQELTEQAQALRDAIGLATTDHPGLAPQLPADETGAEKFLDGTGNWVDFRTSIGPATTEHPGLAPQLPAEAGADKYMDGTGAWKSLTEKITEQLTGDALKDKIKEAVTEYLKANPPSGFEDVDTKIKEAIDNYFKENPLDQDAIKQAVEKYLQENPPQGEAGGGGFLVGAGDELTQEGDTTSSADESSSTGKVFVVPSGSSDGVCSYTYEVPLGGYSVVVRAKVAETNANTVFHIKAATAAGTEIEDVPIKANYFTKANSWEPIGIGVDFNGASTDQLKVSITGDASSTTTASIDSITVMPAPVAVNAIG